MRIYDKLLGGDSYKRNGVARRKFCKESLTVTKILFCGRGLKLCTPQRGTDVGPSKVPRKLQLWNFYRLNTLTGTKNTLYPLEARTSNPVVFI